MNRKPSALILAAALALAGIGFIATPMAQAAPQVSAQISLGVAPPAPRFERVPPPRTGFVWAPGHWRWNPRARRYVWANGRWMRGRPGYRYAPARWQRGPHGHWHYRAGYWAH